MSLNGSNCYACSAMLQSISKHFVKTHIEATQILDLSSIPDSTGYYCCSVCDRWENRRFFNLKKHYMEYHSSGLILETDLLKYESQEDQLLEGDDTNLPGTDAFQAFSKAPITPH